jgi:hypothetical protein
MNNVLLRVAEDDRTGSGPPICGWGKPAECLVALGFAPFAAQLHRVDCERDKT